MTERKHLFVHLALVLMFIVSCASTPNEVGTLHESSHDQWKEGSAGNKFSTAADWFEEFPTDANGVAVKASKERTVMVVDCIDYIVRLTDKGPNFGESETRKTAFSCIIQLMMLNWSVDASVSKDI